MPVPQWPRVPYTPVLALPQYILFSLLWLQVQKVYWAGSQGNWVQVLILSQVVVWPWEVFSLLWAVKGRCWTSRLLSDFFLPILSFCQYGFLNMMQVSCAREVNERTPGSVQYLLGCHDPRCPNGAFPRGTARGITEEEGNCFLEELELNVSLLTSNSALMG